MDSQPIRFRLHCLTSALALAALVALPTAASAQTLLEDAQADGIHVAFYNFVPWAYVNENGDIVGSDVDILTHVLNEMGIEDIEFTATEWGSLIPGLNAGRFDVVAAGMYVTPQRCEQVAFSEPDFAIRHAFIVPTGNPDSISDYNSIADLGLTVGMISGSAYVGYSHDSGIDDDHIVQLPDNPTGVAALRAGRIDAWSIGTVGMDAVVEGQDDLEVTEPFDEVAGRPNLPHGAFAFRPEDANFVEAFNEILVPFVGSDEFLEILANYGMDDSLLPRLSTEELCAGQ